MWTSLLENILFHRRSYNFEISKMSSYTILFSCGCMFLLHVHMVGPFSYQKTDYVYEKSMLMFLLYLIFDGQKKNWKLNLILFLWWALQEVWTLCRIFKRIPSHRKYTPNLQEHNTTLKQNPTNSSSKTSSFESESAEQCVSYGDSAVVTHNEAKPVIMDRFDDRNYLLFTQLNSISQVPFAAPAYSGFWNLNGEDLLMHGNCWDELRSVVERVGIDPCQAFEWR